MWRKFHILRCSVVKDVWKYFLAAFHVNCEHQDPLLMQCIFDECFNFVITLLLLLLTGTIFSYFCMSSITSVLVLAI